VERNRLTIFCGTRSFPSGPRNTWACKFCQNWDISKSREVETLSEVATPDAIARAAVETGCRSVAFTYNDPVVFMEYAIDSSQGVSRARHPYRRQ
jgi:pyruvate formate lyase activating enzyme